MPRRATVKEMPTRKRDGGGRSRVYEIDLRDLADIVGAKDEDGNPIFLVFEPQDLASATGDVAQLTTFTNQVRTWVEDHNEKLPKGAQKFRAQTKNYPIRDKNGNVARGTVKDGKVVLADPDADDYKDFTELYHSWIAIVELTDKDLRNRKARQNARRKGTKNGKAEASKEAVNA